MDNASYVALSRQLTLRRELDITANNMANMNTNGYKFEQLLVHQEYGAPAYNSPIRTPANFAYDNQVGRDFSQGTFQITGSPLDFAIDGEGVFFTIQTAQGEVYTRDGAFTMNAEGMLMTEAGNPVMGDGGPIALDPKKGQPSVSEDGIITQDYQGQAERVGKLSMVRIADMSDLEKAGDGTYRLKSNATAVPATDARLRQGFLEASNVNPMIEVTKLIEINRAYTTLAGIVQQQHDLNKSAVERLGRVT
jgi:flagellar basal-body rod protein FlgF